MVEILRAVGCCLVDGIEGLVVLGAGVSSEVGDVRREENRADWVLWWN